MEDIQVMKFGALLSPEDERDFKAGSYLPVGTTQYPENFMVHSATDIIYNQYITQKCTGYTSKDILESHNKYDTDNFIPMSVDYIFSNRYPDQDNYGLLSFEGAYPRDILQSLQRSGCCEDKYLPTKQPDTYTSWDVKIITDEARENAKKYAIKTYLRIYTDDEIKNSLINLGGVFIVIAITDKFIGGYNSIISRDYARSNNKGYHAVSLWGWKKHTDGKTYWILKNSWGKDWGDNGWFYLEVGYPFFEAWAITDKLLTHWSNKYYQYLTDNFGIVFDELGYDIPAKRGLVFKYFARVLGCQSLDENYDNYWDYCNKHNLVIYSKDYDRKITRAEIFALLSRLKGIKEPVKTISGKHWGQVYWDYLNKNGIKIFDTRFDDLITRAECITLLSRLKGYIEK